MKRCHLIRGDHIKKYIIFCRNLCQCKLSERDEERERERENERERGRERKRVNRKNLKNLSKKLFPEDKEIDKDFYFFVTSTKVSTTKSIDIYSNGNHGNKTFIGLQAYVSPVTPVSYTEAIVNIGLKTFSFRVGISIP